MKDIALVFCMALVVITNSYSQECVDEAYRKPLAIVAQDFFSNGLSSYNNALEAKKSFDWNDWTNSLHVDTTAAYQNFVVVQTLGSRFSSVFSVINRYDLQNKIRAIPLVRSDLNSKLKKERMESSSIELAQELSAAEQEALTIVSDIENCQ